MSLALLGVGAGGAAGYDADAQAFFTAYTITDNTQKSAVNQLVLDLKAAGLWTNMVAIYPIVGGTAATHAGNLRSPGTYDLTFTGTFTHSSTGALPDGSTAYADTGLDGGFASDQSLSYYSRTTGLSTGGELGVSNFGNTTQLLSNYYLSSLYCVTNSGTPITAPGTMTGYGFLAITRVDSSTNEVYQGGALYDSSSSGAAGSFFARPIYFFAVNAGGTASFLGTRECAFGSIYNGGMDSTENSDLYTAVQAYQTTLSRQV